jgi:hypothetical protein
VLLPACLIVEARNSINNDERRQSTSLCGNEGVIGGIKPLDRMSGWYS